MKVKTIMGRTNKKLFDKGKQTMSKIIFFYDESEHSRRLTQDTLSANNFADNFLAGIIGYSDSNSFNVEKAYDYFLLGTL